MLDSQLAHLTSQSRLGTPIGTALGLCDCLLKERKAYTYWPIYSKLINCSRIVGHVSLGLIDKSLH